MTDAGTPIQDRGWWIVIALLTALGLGLRLAAAQGALWLDEAWSAVAAADVGTPLGVFLKINHDNNHHLNTLWLQLVGPGAPPMFQRGFSILTGTLAIPLAAAIAARQSRASGLCAALLFAVSPLLVTYGAEARGYAPMVLALLGTMLIVARWLDDTAQRVPAIPLVLTVLLGMFSQLTMAFGLVAVAMWVFWALYRSQARPAALRSLARILPPLLLPALAAVALVFWAAHAAGTGLQFGNLEAFDLKTLGIGWGAMMISAFGGPLALLAGLILLLPSDRPGDRAGHARDRLFFGLALLIPLGVALLQPGNSGAPRYHLLSGVGALMLVAIHSAPRLAPQRRLRWLIGAALGLIVVASLITDWRLIANRRADPGAALDAIAARAPGGALVAVDRDRSTAILRAASASRRYPLMTAEAPCPAAPFLFVDRDGTQPFPDPATRCGTRYHLIAEGHPTGLSGTHWKLYERDGTAQ